VFLIMIFNYTAGSICMYIFAANDPFHFGTLPRSMFSMLQSETLDNWVISQVFCGRCDYCDYTYQFIPLILGSNFINRGLWLQIFPRRVPIRYWAKQQPVQP
jgi:hypothetical protein